VRGRRAVRAARGAGGATRCPRDAVACRIASSGLRARRPTRDEESTVSIQPCNDPDCAPASPATVRRTVRPKPRDLGGFEVRRVLPAPDVRSVGPFVFFDQMGPADFRPGEGIDVRPHPHVCLATVTYLFEGELMHRDSLGSAQLIAPGAVNLMIAGHGIVHSERAGPDRDEASRLFGIQSWMALPAEHEETAPRFVHHPAGEIPEITCCGARVRVVMGEVDGTASPVEALSPTLYLDVDAPARTDFRLPGIAGHGRAVYVVSGAVTVDGSAFAAGNMLVLHEGADLALYADADSRLIVIGGEPLGRRHIWWNFVASDAARIERAKEDWRAGRFPAVPGDEDECIPLPG
jgi:redox-sensitive bicupin YhaK (pirin superfamily)